MFRANSRVQCYFCHSSIESPRNASNFRCSSCGCWNRYDANGEILSYEPAMHDEALNSRSFSKRASPSKNSLPTMFGKGPFCHTCQTNQMLIVNLLSNYLPEPTDSSYQRRLDDLPAYQESLYLRYPPVCGSCLPAVEDEIQRKNSMARSQALGGWLKQTKGKERQRRVSGTKPDKSRMAKEIAIWRTRGVLWALTLVLFMMGNCVAVLGYSIIFCPRVLTPALPFFVFLSLLWTAWDPTYSSFRKAQIQRRDVRLQGKKEYLVLQMLSWSSRLVTSLLLAAHWHSPHLNYLRLSSTPSSFARLYFGISLILEIIVSIRSLSVLRIQTPPTIRLIDTESHKIGFSRATTPNVDLNDRNRSSTPAPSQLFASEPGLFASLTLSSKPVVNAPVFGHPSLGVSSKPSPSNADDQMDWSPTDETSRNSKDSGFSLRPQRFFAPEQPTGLETLFEKTKLIDDVTMSDSTNEKKGKDAGSLHMQQWWWLYIGVLVLVLGVGLYSLIHSDHKGAPSVSVDSSHRTDTLNTGVFRHIIHSEDGSGTTSRTIP
ncbi:hypothetical protein E1B28_000913 [Marasmius oreades]|uniref:Ima1 N-terminal domain-containing protein n=1 Tax=Marasmius oreades TaxID=181124 RepID=A0A9P7V2G9_9AGAR|nr:uncharacterized protein E1B28_000913 [Marasmius oreades]KAG7099033.1 hypothetical protein E1B28_000913 [Marasmius oreades]